MCIRDSNYDARLDMRMNQEASLDAHYIVNHYSYEQLVEILYKYADEKFAKQIYSPKHICIYSYGCTS